MRSIALLCVALAATPAMAEDLVAYEGTDMIRLTPQACTNEAVLNRVEPEARALFWTASAVLHGQRYTACWRIMPMAAYLLYEDGDQGLIPLEKLQVPVDL